MKRTDMHHWKSGAVMLLRNALPAVAILAGGLWMQQHFQHEIGKRNSRQYSREMASLLQEKIITTPASGAVRSLGISNKRLKAVVGGKLPEDNPDLVISLESLRKCIGADLVYAMNRDGRVVCSTVYDDGRRLTGNNYAFRPYFQKAIAGKFTTFPALGATTFQRGLYYAAPIRTNAGCDHSTDDIIGVVVIKMPFDAIDNTLSAATDLISLVSPQGVVLSSSNHDWLFSVIPQLESTATNTATETLTPEYDSAFFLSRTHAFPLSLETDTNPWQGTNYFIQAFPFNLDDPAGDWTLLVLQNTSDWYPPEQTILTTLLLLAFCIAVGTALYARKRRHLATAAKLKAIAESAQTYKSIFNATTDALFVHHAETGNILDVNESARKVYGYTNEDIANLSPDGEYPYPPEAAAPALKAAMENRKQIITFQSKGRNRRVFWAQASFSVYTIQGSTRVLACVHDVTEQRATHIALTASKEMLEKEVEIRTVQLLQAQKMAAIGKFAERITHDVTNAMTRIIGHADMIRRRPQDLSVRDNALKEIDTAAREMCAFSTDLLAFSHPVPLKLEPMNLVRTIESFQGFIRHSAPGNIEVRFQLTSERLMAKVSSNHIEQALAQLALNSFESMPKGGSLTISLRRGEGDDRPVPNASTLKTPPTSLAVIEVIDTGSGIAPEHVSHVFDPFFTTKTDSKRRGMGLTTVYLIVSRHNGWVNVLPHQNRAGNTVQIWLPLLPQPEKS